MLYDVLVLPYLYLSMFIGVNCFNAPHGCNK